MLNQLRFTGTSVVVTGAAAGIGAAVAEQLAQLDAHVVAVDVDETGLARLVESLAAQSLQATSVVADVREPASATRVDAAVAGTGVPLKALVNNVGVNRKAPFSEVTEADWNETLALNLTSAFRLTQVLLRRLLAAPGGGAVVNVSSVHALRGQPGATGYATTKAGLIGFTRQLAAEYSEAGLRANVVCPGLTMTERILARGHGEAQEALRDRLLDRRFAEPAEVANAITFLASTAASYINGVVLPVDGGFTAR
ncbi:SDR family NAD(P)-dependent oxidoreductase [Microbispora sp. H10836]|uniref:SDR family NAD(P)-dependent oxidoreductase n=1 Tax=Microbispora sp. H10836 TaxID=2729106 RepID=UPI001474D673|nr:SDR family NAD(P)-dependent oxidoreductase [Microbispora sp. H10836]